MELEKRLEKEHCKRIEESIRAEAKDDRPNREKNDSSMWDDDDY